MGEQFFTNALISAAGFFLIGISFSLIYIVSRFFHFAHGVVFTIGAYLTFLFSSFWNLPISLSIILSIAICAIIGCLMEIGVYSPLKRKNSSALILLIASLGLYIVLQNLISMIFGDDIKTIRSGDVQEGLRIFDARITPIQILIILVSLFLVVALSLLLKKTILGRAMRAVANDPELAKISGIDSDRVILWAFAIGSGLAGLAGILVALDVDMTPTMGMHYLMMGIVAVIIGGVGSIPGVALGALLLGFAQHFGVWKISSQRQDAIAFIILLIFLLFRPQGFLGKRIKKASV